jgi:hypothetical protein
VPRDLPQIILFLTWGCALECSSFEEVEGQLNFLQDELQEIRERSTPNLPNHWIA